MTEWLIWLSWPLLLAGMFFFISGTLGVLRFPDVYSRLHAVTKADTLGLG
ncbi:MAG: monovalent cation/H(+) antiporter subunit G, partial [Pseudomonas sp.]|nr:monovalent cation/H(+) antiporter subunit G [Pseudomonas sp.]